MSGVGASPRCREPAGPCVIDGEEAGPEARLSGFAALTVERHRQTSCATAGRLWPRWACKQRSPPNRSTGVALLRELWPEWFRAHLAG